MLLERGYSTSWKDALYRDDSSCEQIQCVLDQVEIIGLTDYVHKASNGLSHICLSACDEDTDTLRKLHFHDDHTRMRLSTDSSAAESDLLWISTSLP